MDPGFVHECVCAAPGGSSTRPLRLSFFVHEIIPKNILEVSSSCLVLLICHSMTVLSNEINDGKCATSYATRLCLISDLSRAIFMSSSLLLRSIQLCSSSSLSTFQNFYFNSSHIIFIHIFSSLFHCELKTCLFQKSFQS